MGNELIIGDLDRRGLLKKVGTAAGLGVMGFNSSDIVKGVPAANDWNQVSDDITVTDATILDTSQDDQRLASVLSSKPVQSLQGAFNERGLRVADSLSFDITTDDAEINALDPVLTMPLFTSGTKQNSDHRRGSLHVLTMSTEYGRKPVAGAGFSLDDDKQGSLSFSRGMGNGTLRGYAFSDNQVVPKGSEQVSYNELYNTDLVRSNDEIGCTECQMYLSGVCSAGLAIIISIGCAFACSRAGYYRSQCTKVCSTVLSAVGASICTYGAWYLCINHTACNS